ncbi:hypothetical protein KEM56_001181 [Ascosphaera pollenicola]|nr:hypothetical protein KEM56_001181 [Ascosphaera pollenicola]
MGKAYIAALAAFAAVGSFLFGYDSGVMTNVIASPNFLEYFDTDPESDIIGAMNSTFSGGAAIGALCGGIFLDWLGRKISLQIGAVIGFVGAIIQCAAQSLAMMLVGRIVAGWAVGLLSMSVPVYQAECAHPKSRGFIIGLAQQMIGVGFIISGWTGYGCNHAPDSSTFQWRFPLGFQAVPAALLAIGMPFFPESPRFLIRKDRTDDAMAALRRLHFDGTNEDYIQQEFAEISEAARAERSVTHNPWVSMFSVPQWRKRLFLAIGIQAMTQTTGTNVINYYQTVMYRNLGIEGDNIILIACFYNMVGPITNVFFITLLVDKVGRRRPLLFGCLAIATCLLLESCVNSTNVDGDKKVASGFGILFIWLVSVFFSLSFGPISWTYMSEVIPSQIRGTGSAFATGIGNWGVGVMWSQVSPKGLGKLGWKYYFVFFACNIALTFPCLYFFFPETKQKTLEEIDDLFGGRVDLDGHLNPVAPEKDVTEYVQESKTQEV